MITLSLVLLPFQSIFASTLSPMDMSSMDINNSHHLNDAESVNVLTNAEDCCSSIENCNMQHCVAQVVAIITLLSLPQQHSLSQTIFALTSTLVSSSHSIIYRPPQA